MEQPNRKKYGSPVFWTGIIGGVTFLCVLIFIIVALGGSKEPPAATDATTQPAPTETIEATLPPPEANPIGLGDFGDCSWCFDIFVVVFVSC